MTLQNWTYDDHSGVGGLPTDHGYWEGALPGDLTETYNSDAAQVQRIYYVLWATRFGFIDDLIGNSYIDNTNQIRRTLPEPHPIVAHFFAVDCHCEPLVIDGKQEIHNYPDSVLAKITTVYKYLDYPVLADNQVTRELDRYVTRKYEPSVEYLTVNGAMEFATSGLPVVAQPGFAVPRIGLTYVWHEVPAKNSSPYIPPNYTKILACLGKVNNTTFDPNGIKAALGTVLCAGIEPVLVSPKLSSDQQFWEITVKLMLGDYGVGRDHNEAGWNYAFDLKNNGWDKVVLKGSGAGGPTAFQATDLNTIFTVG